MADPDQHEATGLLRRRGARSITIPLHGEIDIATAPATMGEIRARLPLGPVDVEFDLAEVHFLGAAGLSLFAQLQLEGHRVRCVHAQGEAALILSTSAAAFLQ